MKRIRVLLSILLAMVLLLIPSAVLADDPNGGVDVDIGIVSGGDVDVDLGIQAGGDVSIDVGTNSDVNVNGDELATKADVSAANQGTVQYEEFVCGGSRMAIKDIYKLLEELYGRQYLIADGLAKDIVFTQETEQWLSRLTAYTYNQDIALENQKGAIVYVNTKMDDLIDVATHQVTALTEQTQRLEQAQLEMRADYNYKLLAISLSALIIIVVLGIIAHRARRRA